MIRTARLGVAAAGLLAALVAPAALASAAPTDPTTPAPPAPSSDTTDAQAAGVDWGANRDGWDVIIVNNTTHVFTYDDWGPASYVKRHDDTIPGNGVGHVKGKESILPWYKNQPANIDFDYHGWTDGGGEMTLSVRSDNKGNMNSTHCSSRSGLKCSITQMQANLPIRIELNPA